MTNRIQCIGCQLNGYTITEYIDSGRIGAVYKAERSSPNDIFACKVIPADSLKNGWERELEKVSLLRRVPAVVPYHFYGISFDNNQRPFCYILWDYIPGTNLRKFIERPDFNLDMAFIEQITETLLNVLYACQQVNISHGDLHEGNILISDPDNRLPGSPRQVYVSDFGYGGSHNHKEPKDDYRQFVSIISSLLNKLNFSSLNPRDRIMFQKLRFFLNRNIIERDPTQGVYLDDSNNFLVEFKKIKNKAEIDSAVATDTDGFREPGDYLWAEALGNRKSEWRALFVPEFLAAQDLLSRNITVLTGARGCGKTMAFRRLTVFMDKVIGESSGVRGADEFVGFYLNCRDLVEAFPWLPQKLNDGMKQQIIHYFHLAWLSELLKTLAICDPDKNGDYHWFDELMKSMKSYKYESLVSGSDVLSHIRSHVENEKERCRLVPLGKYNGLEFWPFSKIEFLDLINTKIRENINWIEERPLYFFLDDYTIPIVPREVQKVLNPIVFKRRSDIFFKVSTEAANSFEKTGIRGKPLELHQDFELIDLATESLHQDKKSKTILLDRIFRPRIDRHQAIGQNKYGLKDILGSMGTSNNDLALQMRENAHNKGVKRVLYHGVEAFVGMWSSDIRIMIQMFADMLRESNGKLSDENHVIDDIIQDKCYRTSGGEFLVFSESIQDPERWEKSIVRPKGEEQYGTHLKEIVEAFIKVSRFEMTKGNLVSNVDSEFPKQAFRIEIIDYFDIPDNIKRYFHGLIRWHIFLQDWRGKSVRGMITPRLYLNRILLPYANLTFSSHDSIHIKNDEFIQLLESPKLFPEFWEKKRKKEKKIVSASYTKGQGELLYDSNNKEKI